uniref:Secreted protein n=1 Tax=Romanomermis culicivorax TaxID=13658 RepID=A0A915KNY8_ROMCU
MNFICICNCWAAAVIVCGTAGGGCGLPWINIDEGFRRVGSGDEGIITFCITLGTTRILKLLGVFGCNESAGKESVQSKPSPVLCSYLGW